MTYTQAMSFSDLVTEVETIRFSAAQSTQIQRWINDRYAALWNSEEWIFKYATDAVTVTTGSSAVSGLASDVGIPIGFWRADGYPLHYLPPRDFFNIYAGATDTGAPAYYTMLNQAITVGPISNETSATYTLAYQKRLTALVADSDTPAIPAEHHYLLVYGALYTGLALYNDFTFQFSKELWDQGIAEMKREWLVDQRGEATVWGRDQVESLPTFQGV